MMPPGTSCSSQRPTSSIIATTALQDIPSQCVAQAISFLGERDKLADWLALKTTKMALWRQGVDEPDVVAATAEIRFLHGEESKHSPHTRYATQLLAQIAWESDLLDEEFVTPTSKAPAVDMPSMPPPRTCSKPSTAKRPSSAPKNPRNENIILQRWEKKLAFAFHLKAQHKKEVEIRAREQNSKIETVRKMHAKLLKESEELQYHKWQGRTKDHDDKIAKSRCAKREICELMMNAAAARQAVLETNRRRILQEQAERQAKRMEQETERQNNAEKKRQDVRNERCVGKPRMRVAREISRKQAQRLERIRLMEREDLRQRLQPSPTATPSPRASRPSSAAASRPRTPNSFVPMPPSRPASARRPRREISDPTPGASRVSRASGASEPLVPDPSCIPLPRYVRRPGKATEGQGPSPEKRGCRSAPAGIAVARSQAVNDQAANATATSSAIDPLGLFPVGGLRCVQSDTLLEMATLNVDDCFADLVYWAWEDASTASTQVQGGTTFLTALDCDKAELHPDSFQNVTSEDPESPDQEQQVEASEGQVCCTCEEPVFCTCEAAEADPSDLGLSTAEGPPGDSVPDAVPERRESIHLTTSSGSTSSS